jgi:hypothetical protein
MSNLFGGSEQNRMIHRIRAITYREARDSGADFITKKWVTMRLGRSESWVTRNWRKTYKEILTHFGKGRPQIMSQESKSIVLEASNRRRKSNSVLSQDIASKRGKTV